MKRLFFRTLTFLLRPFLIIHLGLVTMPVMASDMPYSIHQEGSQQLVVVITEDENATSGLLSTYELREDMSWAPHSIEAEIVVGRTGVAWGKGLHPAQNGLQKQEGDGKAPAGIFRLGDAFGYLSALHTKLNYLPMTANDYCIDIVDSPLYNQLVSTSNVGDAAVKGSSEPMRRDIHSNDHLYKKGIIVHHNEKNISPNGSCIFMHIWRTPTKPTAGCTAMSEPKMDALLAWLDKDKQPLLVTLTKAQYSTFQSLWKLP